MKKLSPFNPFQKAVPIQPILKKPSPFNPFDKAVLIQPIWKSRPYSTHLKKPSSFNSYELIQPSRKSRSYSTQSEKPFPSDPVEKVVLIRPSRKSRSHSITSKKPLDHLSALITQLHWALSSLEHSAVLIKTNMFVINSYDRKVRTILLYSFAVFSLLSSCRSLTVTVPCQPSGQMTKGRVLSIKKISKRG